MPGIRDPGARPAQAGVIAGAAGAQVGRPGEGLERADMVDPGRLDPLAGVRPGPGDGAGRPVDGAGPDRGDGRVGVGMRVTTSSSVPGCARWKSAQEQTGWGRAAARSRSTRSARRPGRTEAAARSAVWRRSRACGRNACPSMVSWAPQGCPGEQPDTEVTFPCGNALGDGLLRDQRGQPRLPGTDPDERSGRVRAGRERLRPAPGGLGHRRRQRRDRLQLGQRRVP